MAITLPSDLIADVMRSADPSRVNSAARRLDSLKSNPGFEGFQAVLGRVGEGIGHRQGSEPHADLQTDVASRSAASLRSTKGAQSEAHVAFEQMFLRNLFESLLPPAETGVFGTGPSAGVWRSLAADQLAGLYAGSGGIGVAAKLSENMGATSHEIRSEWPYFGTDKIVAFAD
jgi:hypothetical protein